MRVTTTVRPGFFWRGVEVAIADSRGFSGKNEEKRNNRSKERENPIQSFIFSVFFS